MVRRGVVAAEKTRGEVCANDDKALREGILSLSLERFDALLRRLRRRLKRFWNVRDFQFTTRKQKEDLENHNILFMDDERNDDLSLLRACEAHLVRLENQRRDLSEDSPFVHRIMGVDPSVVEAMRRDTEKGIGHFRRVQGKIANKTINVSEWSASERELECTRDRIKKAFKTDEIYLMFFEKDRGGLRDRLRGIERELKLDWKRKGDELEREKLEILAALKKLGEKMTEEEKLFLREGLERGVMEELEVLDDV